MRNTDITLRNQMLYQVFVRNHTEEGTFAALERDLDRIKELGTDIVYLLPVQPCGVLCRKGEQGSPYAIRDYRAVDPAQGTIETLQSLVDEIHRRGMKCIIDCVYNHTSRDAVLLEEHPEYYYHKEDGTTGNKIGDWYDVIDLDYRNEELWQYQIDTLCMWAEIVDGFRCDVASMVPIEFWIRAREAVEQVRPGAIWMSESIDANFIRDLRARHFTAHSDCEMYQAFDVLYDYDVFDLQRACMEKRVSVKDYVEALRRQQVLYPENYIKARFLENHDMDRAASILASEEELKNWLAFTFLNQGLAFVYAGQECGALHRPSLFDIDKVDWTVRTDLSDMIRKLSELKKKEIFAKGSFEIAASDQAETIQLIYRWKDRFLMAFIPIGLQGSEESVCPDIPDGKYTDLLSEEEVIVKDKKVCVEKSTIVFEGCVDCSDEEKYI